MRTEIERGGGGGGELTNGSDEVEIEDAADPIDTGDDGDLFFRNIEDLPSELLCRAFGVPGGHDGEKGKAGRGVGR